MSVAFVILVYRFSVDVSLLVDSLIAQFGDNVLSDVFIVENFSSEVSSKKLYLYCEDTAINFCGTFPNNGYGAGNNIGIKSALKAGYDFVSVLNPDTIVHNFPRYGWGEYCGGIVGQR